MKAFVAVSSLLGLAAADPWYAPALAKPYPSWPGVVGPGFESTCYGCGLGKRSADAEPEAWAPLGYYGLGYGLGGGVAGHPTGVSYTQRSPQGLGKRSAEPWGYYGLGWGVAGHPGAAVSYTQRSPQGLGKREAEEEPKALATHPSGGTSYVGRTVFGYPAKAIEKREAEEEAPAAEPEAPKRGYVYIGPTTWGFPAKAVEKREAEPWGYYGLGWGVAGHYGGGVSYTQRSPQGLGKREAEPAVSYSNRSPQGAYGFGWGPAPYYWG